MPRDETTDPELDPDARRRQAAATTAISGHPQKPYFRHFWTSRKINFWMSRIAIDNASGYRPFPFRSRQ